MGPQTSARQHIDQRWAEEPWRRWNQVDSGSGGTLTVVGGEWDEGLWACASVFIYDGSVWTVGRRCDVGGPDRRTKWG
jgi:hypothetical protein